MQLVVGRIGRAHGVLGEATIEVRTDDADQRFSIGNKLTLDNGKELEIKSSRWHNQVLLLSFIGINDRNQVEELRDQLVSADVDINQLAPGEYHYQQLIGCEVFLENSDLVGKVIEVDESLQDAVTATSGSGPAYFFRFVEAMVDGSVAMGLSREDATKLTIQMEL